MTDVDSSSKDPSSPSGDSSSLTVTQKPKFQEGFKKKHVQLKSSLGLVGCLANIAKFIIMGIFSLFVQKSGINWFLRLFGLALKPLNMNNKREKRKHSEVDNEECDDEKIPEELEEMKIKRWRPDHVYEAINEFVKKMWGEKDTNENIKEEDPSAVENDENMNNFDSVHDGKWNKKPDINFVPKRALVGIQTVGEGESSIIRDLTPKKIDFKGSRNEEISSREEKKVECEADETVDELDNDEAPRSLGTTRNLFDVVEETGVQTSTPLIESKAPEVFVFSADKTTSSKVAEDIPQDEQSMLSLMTFGEKQVYFAQQIQAQEAAALKAAQHSPLPSPRSSIA